MQLGISFHLSYVLPIHSDIAIGLGKELPKRLTGISLAVFLMDFAPHTLLVGYSCSIPMEKCEAHG